MWALHTDGEKGKDMRVIAGSARRIQLQTPQGMETRPTTDRIKETLFNMLQSSLYDCSFLDLFSGSGAIGIEALSRGAKEACFVEQGTEAIRCIQKNLKNTKLSDTATVLQMDVTTAIERLERESRQFDIVFMDPPYRQDWERIVLVRLRNSGLVHTQTQFIFEAALDTDLTGIEQLGYEIVKIKKYKTNMHVFLSLA